VDREGVRSCDIGVRGPSVAVLAAPGCLPQAKQRLDASGHWIFPGFVDAHFHCRAPDHPEREDFTSGTSAAAAGGVTTILEMPIADIGVSNVERWHLRERVATRQALVDFGLFAGAGDPEPTSIPALARQG